MQADQVNQNSRRPSRLGSARIRPVLDYFGPVPPRVIPATEARCRAPMSARTRSFLSGLAAPWVMLIFILFISHMVDEEGPLVANTLFGIAIIFLRALDFAKSRYVAFLGGFVAGAVLVALLVSLILVADRGWI